jgi:hypothetical protein
MNLSRSVFRRPTFAVALLAVLAALAAVWISTFNHEIPPTGSAPTAAALTHEPESAFTTVRHVIATGGCPLTRETAIAWLDQQSRERQPLDSEAANTLLEMLSHAEGHLDWSSGYRQHLFNSACNALRVSPLEATAVALARTLHAHATDHPDRILRLYALQHIDSLRKSGHLAGPLAGEIHATLHSLAATPENDIAGTAIQVLADWDGSTTDAPPAILELAAHAAADRSRPVDIRVSAIHTAGPSALEAARTIASDTTEPVILRKAAIARIALDGGNGDLPVLQSLRAESSRIAQAADPAIHHLQSRLRDPAKPAPVPYH